MQNEGEGGGGAKREGRGGREGREREREIDYILHNCLGMQEKSAK